MTKVTRRFFLGAAALLPLTWTSLAKAKLAAPREEVTSWWRRFNRWRHGMEPRWVEQSSTTFHRQGAGSDPRPRKYTDVWRELRWPDNDELVERTPCETKMEYLPADGMEWSDQEQGFRLPGPKCKTGFELEDKVRHAAKYPISGEEGDKWRNRWIRDAKRTVELWDRRAAPAAPACKFSVDDVKLLEPALKLEQRMSECEKAGHWPLNGRSWYILKMGRWTAPEV